MIKILLLFVSIFMLNAGVRDDADQYGIYTGDQGYLETDNSFRTVLTCDEIRYFRVRLAHDTVELEPLLKPGAVFSHEKLLTGFSLPIKPVKALSRSLRILSRLKKDFSKTCTDCADVLESSVSELESGLHIIISGVNQESLKKLAKLYSDWKKNMTSVLSQIDQLLFSAQLSEKGVISEKDITYWVIRDLKTDIEDFSKGMKSLSDQISSDSGFTTPDEIKKEAAIFRRNVLERIQYNLNIAFFASLKADTAVIADSASYRVILGRFQLEKFEKSITAYSASTQTEFLKKLFADFQKTAKSLPEDLSRIEKSFSVKN